MIKTLLALVYCAGVLSHILLFRRSEWDRHSPKLVLTYVSINIFTFFTFIFTCNYSVTSCLFETSLISCGLTSGMFTSMIVYRLILHPLTAFPGPFAARISSAWAFREQWPDLKLYTKLRNMHDHYGDFVRISKKV
jgi:uncharacterized membrane protein YagU involved in acid resistance